MDEFEWWQMDEPEPFEEGPEEGLLPAYMQPVPAGSRTYGELSFNRRRKCWQITGSPMVAQLAMRLFPGSVAEGRGKCRFADSRRAVGDLNWLMQRYPLHIRERDLPKWQERYAQAAAHARARELALRLPPSMTPRPGVFTGELMAFQREGMGHLWANPRTLLADEMGLGKTVQALSVVAEGARFPCLVVVPPHLVLNWRHEIERFVRLEGEIPRVHIVRGLKPYPLPEAEFYLIHYLLLRGWKEVLPKLTLGQVIFDEVQELRHGKTEKYSAASLLSDACECVMGLSGTPIYNRGGEIWNVINAIEYHALGDWESFTRQWCYGYNTDVVADPELLGEYLKQEGLLYRRTKAQVLSQLPPKRRLVQQIDQDGGVYQTLMQGMGERLRTLKDTQDPGQAAILADAIAQQERQATGLAKAPFVAAFVKGLLEGGERVLLFAHHHAVMDLYAKELAAYQPVFITGRESLEKKQQSVEAFMRAETNLCCISLRSAAGLNLQRASCVVFGELDWSPAVHAQAEDRAHRIGQQDSLLCYYLVSPGGSDEQVQEALGLKVSQFTALMGDAPESELERAMAQRDAQAHIQRLVERLNQTYGIGEGAT